jgi:hypothetical protein
MSPIKASVKIGLRHPNLKMQQGVVKNHPDVHNRPKYSGHITQKTYIAGPTNKSSLNDGAKEVCARPPKDSWAEGFKASSWDSPGGAGARTFSRGTLGEATSHKLYEREKGKFKQFEIVLFTELFEGPEMPFFLLKE